MVKQCSHCTAEKCRRRLSAGSDIGTRVLRETPAGDDGRWFLLHGQCYEARREMQCTCCEVICFLNSRYTDVRRLPLYPETTAAGH